MRWRRRRGLPLLFWGGSPLARATSSHVVSACRRRWGSCPPLDPSAQVFGFPVHGERASHAAARALDAVEVHEAASPAGLRPSAETEYTTSIRGWI